MTTLEASPYRYADLPWNDNYALGRGVDLLTGNPTLDAVTGVTESSAPDAIQSSHNAVISDHSSYSSLISSITSAEGSSLLSSESASLSFIQQQSMDQTTLSFVIGTTIRATSDFPTPENYSLSASAAADLRANGPDSFVQKYGTHYVAGIRHGGSYLGVITIRAKTSTDQQTVQASMHATINGEFAGGTIDSTFTSNLNSINVSYNLQAQQSANGAIVQVSARDLDALTLQANAVATDVAATHGRPMSAIAYAWDTLNDVQKILEDTGHAGALTLTVSPFVAQTLMTENAALQYQINTAQSILNQGSYQLPHQQAVLEAQVNAAVVAQNAITSLTLPQISRLDAQSVQSYIKSPQIAAIIAPMSNGSIALSWSGFLDGAFVTSQQWTQVPVLAAFSPADQFTLDSVHRRPEGNNPPQHAQLGFVLNSDATGMYLQGVFNWTDPYGPGSGRVTGPRIDLKGDNPTQPSTIAWPAYPDNYVSVQLV
jgi:hypothetical protein